MSRIFSSAEPDPQLTWTAMIILLLRCEVKRKSPSNQNQLGWGTLMIACLARQQPAYIN